MGYVVARRTGGAAGAAEDGAGYRVEYAAKKAYLAFLKDRRKRKINFTSEEGHERKGEVDAKPKAKKVDRPKQSTTHALGSH